MRSPYGLTCVVAILDIQVSQNSIVGSLERGRFEGKERLSGHVLWQVRCRLPVMELTEACLSHIFLVFGA